MRTRCLRSWSRFSLVALAACGALDVAQIDDMDIEHNELQLVFEEDAAGLAAFDAENFATKVARSGHDWTLVERSGQAGAGAMRASPNDGTLINTGFVSQSPRLSFTVSFQKTGTHYVWVRGLAPSPSKGNDSCHVGLDGAAVASADKLVGFGSSFTWQNRTADNSARATLNVTSTGLHTIDLWMREDGLIVDKVVVTTSSSYTPSGLGPAETIATSDFTNRPFATQSGAFTLRFDAVPLDEAMNGVMGASRGPASDYTDLAAAVRFDDSGRIDARNGGAYAAVTTIPYVAGTRYSFRLEVDVANRRYSAYVTPAGAQELAVGTAYAFRTEQAQVTALDTLADYASVGTQQISNVSVTPAAIANCGDDACNGGETCTSCAADCGACPAPTGCDGLPYTRLVAVSSASQLSSALANAKPGDLIRMADGTYNGRFRPSVSGTQSNRISLCGSQSAVISDASEGGYALGPSNASWWVFRGFTIDRGLKGIMSDNSHDNVYEQLTVKNIYGECVHLRQGSSRNTIRSNHIHHCGLHARHGEGVYVGSSPNNFTNDQANDNQILDNLIEDTSADAVDLKEATRRSIVRGNVARRTGPGLCALDGTDCSSSANTTATMSGRPGDSLFECNDIYAASDLRGIQIYSGGDSGDGDNNIIRYNRVTGGSGAVSIHSTQTGNQVIDNTASGYLAHCQ
jgi:hypothetical protein